MDVEYRFSGTLLISFFMIEVYICFQNAARLLISMNANVIGSMLTWKFLKENWDKLTKIHPVAEFTMREIIRSCLCKFLYFYFHDVFCIN